MAADTKISKRYARALLELCQASELEAMRDSLTQLSEALVAAPGALNALANPAYPMAERAAAIRSIAEKVRPGDPRFANFAQIVLEAGRLGALREIGRIFADMVDQLKKRLALEITSAHAIPSGEQQEMQQMIEKEFGSLASVQWSVDSKLIGGLRVRAGDKLLDSSIQGALESLEERLIG